MFIMTDACRTMSVMVAVAMSRTRTSRGVASSYTNTIDALLDRQPRQAACIDTINTAPHRRLHHH